MDDSVLGRQFWNLVWDLVRLVAIPLAAILLRYGLAWIAAKVKTTDLGKRLKIIELATNALGTFITDAEAVFGGAKTEAERVEAKRYVLDRFSTWLRSARLEDYFSDADRSALIEWVLARLGLKDQTVRAKAGQRPGVVQPVILAPPPPNGRRN